ncbi:uncharacterized protein ACNLHF_008239 [Anomaloglossus baeobatrachus]
MEHQNEFLSLEQCWKLRYTAIVLVLSTIDKLLKTMSFVQHNGSFHPTSKHFPRSSDYVICHHTLAKVKIFDGYLEKSIWKTKGIEIKYNFETTCLMVDQSL